MSACTATAPSTSTRTAPRMKSPHRAQRDESFTESRENVRDLTRIVRARWKNIVKASRALGHDPGRKPPAPT